MKKTYLGWILLIVLVLALVAYLTQGDDGLKHAADQDGKPRDVASAAKANSTPRFSSANENGKGKPKGASQKMAGQEKSKKIKATKDAKRADLLRKEIKRIFAAAKQAQKAEDPKEPSDARTLGTLEKEYILEAIEEIKPLLKECMSLAQSDGQKAIDGRLRVNFEVSGDPELGGVIGASQILDGGTIQDPGFQECVRETMYAVVLDAPKGGGLVKVTYPFVFQSAPSEAAQEASE